MVKERTKKRKPKIKPKQRNPILCDPAAISYLEALHKHFIVITIDTTTILLLSAKKYYSSKLLVGLTQNLKHIQKLHITSRK